MKSLVRTIVVLTTFNLAMGSSGLTMGAPEERPGVTVVEPPEPQEVLVESPQAVSEPVAAEQPPTPVERPTLVEPTAPVEPPTPRKTFHTISGRTGVGGVMMNGLPGNPVSGADGSYSAVVEHGWSGTVIPAKEGYTFEPASRVYDRVAGHLANQDYIAILITFTISGTTGLEGVVMQGLPGDPITHSEGHYSATVDYGWSGRVAPKKQGYIFHPPYRMYTDVTAAQSNQNYVATPWPMVRRADGRRVLVIPATETQAEDIAAIHEDMYVMAHIFDQKAKEPRLIRGVFVDYGKFFGRDSRDTEAIYIQGYGALFLMEVDLPISATPKPEQEKAEPTQEHVDPIWQQAQRELFSPKVGRTSAEPGLTEYGPEKVQELKKELIKTLKHAGNIRGLKPDEWIILTVLGGAQQPTGAVNLVLSPIDLGPRQPQPVNVQPGAAGGGYGAAASYGGGGYGGYGYGAGGYGMAGFGAVGFPSATVLTIRAKKADVDAYAKGQMDFDEFQDRVLVFTYPHLSGKATGGQRIRATTKPTPIPAPPTPR